MLTREEFIKQFPDEVDISKVGFDPVLSEVFQGVEVYRLLNMLVIKMDGKFYADCSRYQ